MTLEEEIRAAMAADLARLKAVRGEGALKPEECMVRAAYFQALALAVSPGAVVVEGEARAGVLERVEKGFESALSRMKRKSRGEQK